MMLSLRLSSINQTTLINLSMLAEVAYKLESCRISTRSHQAQSCAISDFTTSCRFIGMHVTLSTVHLPLTKLQLALLTPKAADHVDGTAVTLQAKDKFEQWHAEKWLSPRRVLQKAGAEMRPVLLPFWLFEAAIKVEYAAQV